MVSPPVALPLFAAFWFFLGAGYFWYKLRSYPLVLGRLYPIALYLVGIGSFFVFQAVNNWTSYSCSVWDCTNLAGGLAVMLAASFIARFPLKERWPDYETAIFALMAAFSVGSQIALAIAAPAIQLRAAHVYAFFVAGVFSVGFIVYQGIRTKSTTGKSIGVSLSSCCVVGHGLAALPLVLTVSAPLIGVPLKAPMLFAILAPVALIAVLRFVARVEPDAAADRPAQTPIEPSS